MIPQVRGAVIDSIREQIERDSVGYFKKIVDEMKQNKPDGDGNLAVKKAIFKTADETTDSIIAKFEERLRNGVSEDLGEEMDILDSDTMSSIALQDVRSDIYNALISIAVSVYQSIKQQMVINELE
jgi:hypothetical protein